MYRQPPEQESDPGRSGLLETIAKRWAEADAARAAWLDARIHERRGRGRSACPACGLKSGHHPECARRLRSGRSEAAGRLDAPLRAAGPQG